MWRRTVGSMTPEAAAELLGVPLGATREQIDAAYARVARSTHPDRFAGADPDTLITASASFVEAAQARDTLRAYVAQPVPPVVPERYPGRTLFVPPPAPPRPPRGPWPVRVWTIVLLLVSVLAALGGAVAFPLSLVILIPLDAAVLAFVSTRRVPFMRLAIALTAVFAVLTAVFGTYIPLAILGMLLAPVVALIVLARDPA